MGKRNGEGCGEGWRGRGGGGAWVEWTKSLNTGADADPSSGEMPAVGMS